MSSPLGPAAKICAKLIQPKYVIGEGKVDLNGPRRIPGAPSPSEVQLRIKLPKLKRQVADMCESPPAKKAKVTADERPKYNCGTLCEEGDWVEYEDVLGKIHGDDWRMCMGTGFELTDEIGWVCYVDTNVNGSEPDYHHDIIGHVEFIGRGTMSKATAQKKLSDRKTHAVFVKVVNMHMAKKIQRVFRGYLRKSAAIEIQRVWRGSYCRQWHSSLWNVIRGKSYWPNFILEGTAVQIQRVWRGFLCRKKSKSAWQMLDGTKMSDKRAPAGGHAWGLDQLAECDWSYGEELDGGVPKDIIPNWPALAFNNGVLQIQMDCNHEGPVEDDESVYKDDNGNEYRDCNGRPLINDREYYVRFDDIDDIKAYRELKAVFGKKKAKEEMKEHRHSRRRVTELNSDTDSDDSDDEADTDSDDDSDDEADTDSDDDDVVNEREDRTCAECKVIVSSPRLLVGSEDYVNICVDCDRKKHPEKW